MLSALLEIDHQGEVVGQEFLEGVIRRRILLNFRADPSVVAPLLPAPLEVLTYDGFAIVGVCLIGMARLRPKGSLGKPLSPDGQSLRRRKLQARIFDRLDDDRQALQAGAGRISAIGLALDGVAKHARRIRFPNPVGDQ